MSDEPYRPDTGLHAERLEYARWFAEDGYRDVVDRLWWVRSGDLPEEPPESYADDDEAPTEAKPRGGGVPPKGWGACSQCKRWAPLGLRPGTQLRICGDCMWPSNGMPCVFAHHRETDWQPAGYQQVCNCGICHEEAS